MSRKLPTPRPPGLAKPKPPPAPPPRTDRMSAKAYRKLLSLSASEAQPKAKQPRQYPESELQAAMIELAGLILRDDVILFSVPNERKEVIERARLRRMGVLSGVADLVVVWGDYDDPVQCADLEVSGTFAAHIGFIEVKTPTGRQSAPQKAFEQRCHVIGVPYAVVRTVDEFQAQLEEWELTR